MTGKERTKVRLLKEKKKQTLVTLIDTVIAGVMRRKGIRGQCQSSEMFREFI